MPGCDHRVKTGSGVVSSFRPFLKIDMDMPNTVCCITELLIPKSNAVEVREVVCFRGYGLFRAREYRSGGEARVGTLSLKQRMR